MYIIQVYSWHSTKLKVSESNCFQTSRKIRLSGVYYKCVTLIFCDYYSCINVNCAVNLNWMFVTFLNIFQSIGFLFHIYKINTGRKIYYNDFLVLVPNVTNCRHIRKLDYTFLYVLPTQCIGKSNFSKITTIKRNMSFIFKNRHLGEWVQDVSTFGSHIDVNQRIDNCVKQQIIFLLFLTTLTLFLCAVSCSNCRFLEYNIQCLKIRDLFSFVHDFSLNKI